jgi:hypothetical protein
MIANLELESMSFLPISLGLSLTRLRSQNSPGKVTRAVRGTMRSRLERRVNRIPTTRRQMPLVELLTPAILAPKPAPTKSVASTKAAPTKKAPASATISTTTTATAKTRTARANTAPSKSTAAKPVASKPAAKPTTLTRGKKRSSDELSSEDKENAALEVSKKRVRAPAQKPAAPATKPATARTTRAASRQKTAPTQVLSPKNNNARQKPTKTNTRQR